MLLVLFATRIQDIVPRVIASFFLIMNKRTKFLLMLLINMLIVASVPHSYSLLDSGSCTTNKTSSLKLLRQLIIVIKPTNDSRN